MIKINKNLSLGAVYKGLFCCKQRSLANNHLFVHPIPQSIGIKNRQFLSQSPLFSRRIPTCKQTLFALLLSVVASTGFANDLTPAQKTIINQCGQALQQYDSKTMPAAEAPNLNWCFKNNACEHMNNTLLDNCSRKLNLWKAHRVAATAAEAATIAGGNPPAPPKESSQKNDKSTWNGYTATQPQHNTTKQTTNKNTQQQKNQTNKKEINWY